MAAKWPLSRGRERKPCESVVHAEHRFWPWSAVQECSRSAELFQRQGRRFVNLLGWKFHVERARPSPHHPLDGTRGHRCSNVGARRRHSPSYIGTSEVSGWKKRQFAHAGGSFCFAACARCSSAWRSLISICVCHAGDSVSCTFFIKIFLKNKFSVAVGTLNQLAGRESATPAPRHPPGSSYSKSRNSGS